MTCSLRELEALLELRASRLRRFADGDDDLRVDGGLTVAEALRELERSLSPCQRLVALTQVHEGLREVCIGHSELAPRWDAFD